MTQPTQVLPYWLSASTSFVTTAGTVYPTTIVVNLPLTYYGASIPLDSGWIFGGSTSPPPAATATGTAAATASASPTDSPAETSERSPRTRSRSPRPTRTRTRHATATGSSSSRDPTAASTEATTSPATSSRTNSTPASAASSSPSSISAVTSSPTGVLSSGSITSSSSISTTPSTSTLTSSPTSSLVSLSTSSPTSASPIPTLPVNDSGLSKGAIIALATGLGMLGLVLVLLCCLIFIFRWRRRPGRPNPGRSLTGDTSSIPRSYGDGEERGSLLAGRRSGGESPELAPPGMEDLSTLPIANKYITERRMRESGTSIAGGSYHAITDAAPEAADEAGVVTLANIGRASRSRDGTASNESGGTVSSRGLFYQPSSSHHGGMNSPRSGMLEEEAQVVTAQRAARGPLARLARLSWFRSARDTLATSVAATGPHSGAPQDSDDDGWVEVPHRSRGLATPLLAAAPGTSRSTTSLNRLGGSAVPLPLHSPPPDSYLRTRGPPPGDRRASAQTVQSADTVYHDAESRPSSPPRLPMPQHITPPADSENEASPGGAFAWPRISPDTARRSGDALDTPVPRPYNDRTPSNSGGTTELPSPWAAALGIPIAGSEAEARRRSAPNLANHPGRGELSTLDEAPPMAAESWKRRLGDSERRRAESDTSYSNRRLTLGPQSFVDTPRLVTQPEISSMHGELRSQYGASTVGSSNPSNPSTSGRPPRPPRSNPGSGPGSPFSSGNSRPDASGRMPSLSAIRGVGASSPAATIASTGGSGSEPFGARSDTTRVTTEMGELTSSSAAPSPLKPIVERPPRKVPSALEIRPSLFVPESSTPPPPPSRGNEAPGLAPPPTRKAWWKPTDQPPSP